MEIYQLEVVLVAIIIVFLVLDNKKINVILVIIIIIYWTIHAYKIAPHIILKILLITYV